MDLKLKSHEIVYHKQIKDAAEAKRLFKEAFIDEVTKIYQPDMNTYYTKCKTSTGDFIAELKNLH